MNKTLLLVLFFISKTVASAMPGNNFDLLKALRSSDESTRVYATNEAREMKNVDAFTQQKILELAKETSDPESYLLQRNSARWLAIDLLGAWKVEPAIPWLIENIQLHSSDYTTLSATGEVHQPKYYFPCLLALENMSSAAAPSIITSLDQITDEVQRNLLLVSLGQISMDNQKPSTSDVHSILSPTLQQSIRKARESGWPAARERKNSPTYSPGRRKRTR